MKIYVTSIYVDDQVKALRFYTEKLGFLKKNDIPIGVYRWLTVVSPEGADDIELLLEPNENNAARIYQQSLYQQGIPIASFEVVNIEEETKALIGKGVRFVMEPTSMGDISIAMFDDTCGNFIQIVQKLPA